MEQRPVMIAGGLSFIVGALAFVSVFSYLAATFDYPAVLDGSAAEVLPRLRAGGAMMRATWALYAFLPLFLVPGAVGTVAACPSSGGRMIIALVAASIGALAMCLGLMRWPSIHWALAEAYAESGAEARSGLSAVFLGLNLYLGNYVGEFLGELCLGVFFLLAGLSLSTEPWFPSWLGRCSVAFAALFVIGAFRNVSSVVQPVADINHGLLPLWMVILGVSLIRCSRGSRFNGDVPLPGRPAH